MNSEYRLPMALLNQLKIYIGIFLEGHLVLWKRTNSEHVVKNIYIIEIKYGIKSATAYSELLMLLPLVLGYHKKYLIANFPSIIVKIYYKMCLFILTFYISIS